MRSFLHGLCIFAAASILMLVHSASGSVELYFTNGTSAYNSVNASPGSTFGVSVMMTETTASDSVSGVDYQIQASADGVFEFLSRNSQVAGSSFTSPNGASDSQLKPAVLNPDNGTDLGTSTSSGLGVSGPGTYEISDFSFEVLPSAPKGIYTLSFFDTDTSGAPPDYTVGSFNALGEYTVFVPGPVLIGDANDDGQIDGSDYSLIDNGYLNHLSGWSNGDFNLDGVIDGSDYTLIDNAYNTQGSGARVLMTAEVVPVVVPEPSVGVLVGLLAPLLRRRCRR